MLAMNPILHGRHFIIDLAESSRVVCIIGEDGEAYNACDCGCTALSDRELKIRQAPAHTFDLAELLKMTNEQITELFEPLRADAPVYPEPIEWKE